MYSRLTKSSINIELVKRVNTDCTPYYAILYLLSNSNKILVENPSKGTCQQLRSSEIGKYIKLNKVKTDWFRNIDGSYMRISNNKTYHILPITHELQLVNIRFYYNIPEIKDFKRIRSVTEKNFKLVKTSRKTGDKIYNITINAFLPIWPMWAKVERHLNDENHYTLKTIYMKHGDQFYRFPYGNVSANDAVCTGGANNGQFKTTNQLWINWITTQFNRDYKLNLKANKFNFKLPEHNETVIEPTFDLNEIALKLYTKSYRNLNLIDVFYYLANIEEFDNLEMDKLFIKLPQNPWEPKKK